MGYITIGRISEWAWSRLFWLPAGFGAWNSTKSSHVSVATADNLCHSTFCGQPKCCCCCCCCCRSCYNWLRIIFHHQRIDILVRKLFTQHNTTQQFGCSNYILYLVVVDAFLFICSFRLTDTNGFRNWIWDGMRYQPCPAWCSIVVAFNSRLLRSVDGICQQKSVAEIYVTWIEEI